MLMMVMMMMMLLRPCDLGNVVEALNDLLDAT